MSFVLQISQQLYTVVTVGANLEASLTSLERIAAYIENTPEDNEEDEEILPTTWPRVPTVRFESYSAAHRPREPLCLRDIDLTIQAFEHVAVIGRTGAGKSSLILALMRALDPDAVRDGRIWIDGVDIAGVRLSGLRKRIAIVPQEPMVFTGTLRDNLDPSGEKSDAALMEVMGRCSLARMLCIDKGIEPLEHMINDGG
jgi:ATP-binding cassette, subfamily C (CFTR/MRP), member 1